MIVYLGDVLPVRVALGLDTEERKLNAEEERVEKETDDCLNSSLAYVFFPTARLGHQDDSERRYRV